MTIQNTISWYDAHAGDLAVEYKCLHSERLLSWLAPYLPKAPAIVLDVGAGTGRDAAWFLSKDYEVVAVEPSAAMRSVAAASYPEDFGKAKWLDDRLPAMTEALRLGVSADVVFLGAVWMHVPPDDRPRAFRKLVSLTRSGGIIAFSIRKGPDVDGRGLHPATVAEIGSLAQAHGLAVVHVGHAEDERNRQGVSWDYVVLRLPDDGTGALPILRHLILSAEKTFTYKLGLLRSVCRVADGSSGMVRDDDEQDDGNVAVPLGLVAANWLRLYLPLIEKNLPQSGQAAQGLGFAKEDGVGKLRTLKVGAFRFRYGAGFSSVEAEAVDAALRHVAELIKRYPSKHATYPNSGTPIFRYVRPARTGYLLPSDGLTIDDAYLATFGHLLVDRDIWRALRHFAHWIEPSLIAEWVRMMRDFARTRRMDWREGDVAEAMAWSDPERDTKEVREIALSKIGNGGLDCVWTGKPLTAANLDIDHCFPWSSWPCGDLWNLVPSHNSTNQHSKRAKLPSDELLVRRRQSILGWWDDAYLAEGSIVAPGRFRSEARASLPGVSGDEASNEDVFTAVRFQQLRLRRDQMIPEWNGRV